MTDVVVAPTPPEEPVAPGLFPWWLVLIQGIAALVIGTLLIFSPARTTIVLVQVFGWYWLFSGIFQVFSVFTHPVKWGWRVASGVLSILAGGYIIASPILGAAIILGVATLLIGINGVIIGVADVVKATHGGGLGIGILGVLSIVIGGAIAFNFPQYALALPWVWGVFAVIGGVVAIVGSFRIRGVIASVTT